MIRTESGGAQNQSRAYLKYGFFLTEYAFVKFFFRYARILYAIKRERARGFTERFFYIVRGYCYHAAVFRRVYS